MLRFRGHERPYYKQYLRDKEQEIQKQETEEQREINEWAENLTSKHVFHMREEDIPPIFKKRESLTASYGQVDVTPPFPRIEFSPKPKNKRRRNSERAELYKMYAECYPDGINMDQASTLQALHPEQLGVIKTNSVMQGVNRAIDRKKRQKWECFE
jgi:hypothetical protein